MTFFIRVYHNNYLCLAAGPSLRVVSTVSVGFGKK